MHINANVLKADVTTFFFLIFKSALRNFIRTKELKFNIKCKKLIILGHNGSENAGLIPPAFISLLVQKFVVENINLVFSHKLENFAGNFDVKST